MKNKEHLTHNQVIAGSRLVIPTNI